MHRLGRVDARQDRVVAALDARHVDEAGRAAEQRAAGEHQLRHRLPAAFGDRARAVGDALAALEHVADGGMRLEALELLERRQIRVLVVEVDDEADRHEVLAVVIEERAAAGAVVERPAERVLHEAGLVLLRLDLPQLLEADAVLLRLAALRRARSRAISCLASEPRAPSAISVYLPRQLHAAREACPSACRPWPTPMSPVATPRTAPLVVVEHLGWRRSPDRSRRRAPSPARRASAPASPRLTM